MHGPDLMANGNTATTEPASLDQHTNSFFETLWTELEQRLVDDGDEDEDTV